MGGTFHVEEFQGPIALVTFDLPEKRVNTLSRPVLGELAELVDRFQQRTDLQGLLFQSGKPGQFVAGADLNELAALKDATREQVIDVLAAGHALLARISQLPFPTVALIDGNCLGGGTELALAMDYRIAAEGKSTKIGLPETTIGLIPGWGGTQRLPRLIGIHHAIEMLTSGNPISAQRAAQLGLVFDVVPGERLIDEGRRLIAHARRTGEWERNRQCRSGPLGLSENQMNFAFAVAEGAVKAKTKGQYPAPLAALKAVREGVNRTLEDGLKVEQEVALEVFGTPICGNLISVFFMNNRVSRNPGVDDPKRAPRPVNRIGVLGAGLMGAGIATAHARSRIPANMVDMDDERLQAGLDRAQHVIASRIKLGRATPEDMANMLAHISTSTSHQVFADCDVVVEAVVENEELKTSLYRELAGSLRDDAILASNTSTISITRMAESAPNAERFAGLHFFFPVDRMQLVEVIRGEKTSDETIATLVALSRRIRKTPIVVKDCPGFLVNRILLPYMNESLLLLLEGASMDQIDKAATRFGMPMGPIALHDLVGLDTASYAGKVMVEAFSDRAVLTPLLEELVEAGRLGKKSGAGFRAFRGRKSRPQADPEIEPFLEHHRTDQRDVGDEEITDRLILPMLLEATRILDEGIVREPSHVDVGLFMGIGFPTFRGGLLRWCDNEGAGKILDRLPRYEPLGKRFEPTEMLTQMAQSGELFYPS